MIAKHEVREYDNDARVFLGKYRNLNNVLHWHYDCEIIFVESGCLEISTGGGQGHYYLSSGQAMYLGNMEEHCIKTKSHTEVYIIIFSYDLLKGIIKNEQLKSPVLSSNYNIFEVYQKIKSELLNKENFYNKAIENIIVKLIIDIFRKEEIIKNEIKKKDKMEFMRLLDDIDKKHSYYTNNDAAEFLCMSKTYFSKYFHKMYGMVFTDYLNTVRISKAVEMLKSNKELSIGVIASNCGFNTIRNFNRVFKNLTRLAPNQITNDYVFEDIIFFASDSSSGFDPTLKETLLLESMGGDD